MDPFKKILTFLLLCTPVLIWAQAYTIETLPNPIATASYVSNPDGILKTETVNALNQQINALRQTNTAQIAVVAVQSIGNMSVEQFATALFKKWGIGTSENNNGLLALFVLDQRTVKFETGYGIEGVFPDAMSKRIQLNYMIPYFKKGDYDTGMLAGMEQVVKVIKGETFVKTAKAFPWNEVLPLAIGMYLFLTILAWAWVSTIVHKVRKSTQLTTNLLRYKTIKSEKAAALLILAVVIPAIVFVGFILLKVSTNYMLLLMPIPLTILPANLYGKIMMRKIRREPIACSECKGTMHLLSEKQEDAHLKLAQQFEEQLQAVDYDVFVCPDCKNETILTYDKPSMYANCPKCNTKAFILKGKQVIVAPTYISGGTERSSYHCKFCGHQAHHNHALPRLQRQGGAFVGGAVAGSILSSGRGGFGSGGSFGGFGGGLSGGGGSSSSW